MQHHDRAGEIPLLGGLVAANLLAWGVALVLFHDQPVLLGTALLAWGLGLRHAVDADHIAAIDGVTRKLVQAGQRPLAVGLFFAVGHSSVVVLASAAVAATATGFAGSLAAVGEVGGLIGSSVSILFLLMIAAANAVILRTVWGALRVVRAGGTVPAEALERMLAGGGWFAALCRPLFRLIGRSWQMAPLGFLFGLGFDTAASIALLGAAATQAASGMAVWAIMVFPLLFAAAMTLVDTLDGMLMVRACDWAHVTPMRKLGYNFAITAVSVAAALGIAIVELAQLLSEQAGGDGVLSQVVARWMAISTWPVLSSSRSSLRFGWARWPQGGCVPRMAGVDSAGGA